MDIRLEPASDAVPQPFPRELGFGRVFTNRMFTQRYTVERGWHNAAIGPHQALTLDPTAALFHCGQMVFDGTKAYRRPDGNLNLFRVERNTERFNRSAARLGMPPVDEHAHVQAIMELVRLEHRWTPERKGAALYIRPVMVALDRTLEVRTSREYLHSILRLAPDLGYTIAEERIATEDVLRDAQAGRITEAFGMGTGAVIAPVGKLGYRGQEVPVNQGQAGPVALRLFDELTGLQYGQRPDPYGWTRIVHVGRPVAVEPLPAK